MRVTTLHNNFSAGELTPKMDAAVDSPIYRGGCRTMVNNVPMTVGGFRRMPGSYHLGYVEDTTSVARLILWVASAATYMIELTALKARFWQADYTLEGTELATPWTAAQLWELQVTNIDGGLYVVHPSHAPRLFTDVPVAISIPTFTGTKTWGAADDYPSICAANAGRLLLGSTDNEPTLLAQSKAPDATIGYRVLDFDIGTGLPDEAIVTYHADGNGSRLLWVAPGRRLTVGSDMSTWMAGGGIPTPATFWMDVIEAPGATRIQPCRIGNAVVYVGGPEPSLRLLRYSQEGGGLVEVDLSQFWDHMLKPGVVEITPMLAPETIVWAGRTDGQLAACRLKMAPGVLSVGWARWVPADGGLVESAACKRTATGDELWMIVNRAGKRCVERLVITEDDDQTEVHYIDSGLRFEYDPPEDTITGLTHLEGKVVHAVGDGGAMPERTVTGGEVTYDSEVSKIHIGLPYESKAWPMRPELALDMTWQGKKKRIEETTLRLYKSMGGKVGHSPEDLQAIPGFTPGVDKFGVAPSLKTGDVKLDVKGVVDTDGAVCITQDDPWPLTVLGVMTRVALMEV